MRQVLVALYRAIEDTGICADFICEYDELWVSGPCGELAEQQMLTIGLRGTEITIDVVEEREVESSSPENSWREHPAPIPPPIRVARVDLTFPDSLDSLRTALSKKGVFLPADWHVRGVDENDLHWLE